MELLGLGVVLIVALAVVLFFIRGLFGPFIFTTPALLLSSWAVGRRSLSLDEMDWVPLAGIIYFSLQAAFEEVALRFLDRRKPDTAVTPA